MPRVLLLLPKTSYRVEAFLEGAARAGADVVVGSDVCHVLHEEWQTGALTLDFDQPEQAAAQIVSACRAPGRAVDAVVPVTDAGALVAALAAHELGLAHNPPEAAYRARNKRAMREALLAARVPQPAFVVATLDDDAEALARAAAQAPGYPCVIKPVLLSASRGVIRADDPGAFVAAFHRIGDIVAAPDLRGVRDADRRTLLVERFVAGAEVALEGMLTDGRLATLALFDKPDPLEGPFFEETIYVAPARVTVEMAERVRETAERAARAMGLRSGPVHAELRVHEGQPIVIEVAARSIGGLCARALSFASGATLEELVVRHALGEDMRAAHLRDGACGVMMIPVPSRGVLEEVTGVEEALGVTGIEDVVIGTPIGAKLEPLPEGASYLGFVFARAGTAGEVEQALRAAHARLRFRIARALT